ncbi:MAG: PPC domain-containing protein [Planctomycetaceae bacterium]|nr:PPC domain-containing protein [Planctomycetaceae bacterium]
MPEIRFDRLTPLGGAAGAVVDVQIAAAKPEGVKRLLFDHPGLSAEFVEEKKFRITIADDVPAGWYDVWLSGQWGISNPRLFAVSHGLEHVADTEPNNTLEQAQQLPVESVVNGTSDGNGEDTYRISLTAGQRIVLDCLAQRLDSQLDATLILRSAEGRVLATSGDYFGSDPFLDFTATAAGDYFATIHDLSYRGGQPYRLVVTSRPHVENVFPRAIQVGRPTTLTAWGRNFGAAGTPSELSLHDQPLEKYSWEWTPPADVFDIGGYRFQEHPTAHSVMPTAATCTLTGMQVQPVIAGTAASPIPMLLTDREVSLEVEPNEDRDHPQPLALPCVLSGRFDHERDADWFAFDVPENGSYEFDVYSERIGGNADPYLVILDDKGNRLNELDDFGHRINAFDGHLRDPSGRVTLTGGRRYRLLVQDRYRRGGPRYQYVLAVRLAEPDFYVATIHSTNPGPAGTTIWKGGAASLDVVIHQTGGYNGPVTLTAEDLPPGLHATPTTIRNTNRGVFVLWADESAEDWTGPIRLVATGVHEGKTFHREVRPFTRVTNQGNSSRPMRHHMISLVRQAPFRLHFEQPQVQAAAGEEIKVTIQVSRLWDEATSSLTLRPLQFPGGISMDVTEIAAGADSASLTLKLQKNVLPGEYTLAIDGQSQVPFSEDPQAATRPKTLVSQPGLPLSLIVLPAAKP